MKQLRSRFQRQDLELEVEEELRLHVDLLLRENIQRGMSPEEARAATLKRFGNLHRIRNECVAISRRSRPLQRVLKTGAILLGLTGLFIRIGSADLHVAHVGDTLIAIAVAGRLWLYVRGLSPARFLPTTDKD